MTKMQQLQVREPRWRLWFRLYCSVEASSPVLWQPAESKESLHCSRPPHKPLCGIRVGSASWNTLNDHLRWCRQGELAPGRGMIQVQALMTGNSWMMLPLCPLLGWHQTPFTQIKRERDGALRGLHFFFERSNPQHHSFHSHRNIELLFFFPKEDLGFPLEKGSENQSALWDF